jgi:hypothetical protein
MQKPWALFVLLSLSTAAVLGITLSFRRIALGAFRKLGPSQSIDGRVAEYGETVRDRLRPNFERVGVAWPPARMTLIGLKEEARLEVWVANESGPWKRLRSYPILGQSGGPGPKLREGDRQVPEGFYEIQSLNPNSRFHLSLRLNYPNADDLRRAKDEGRDRPGSDIMIHGGKASIGCLAIGDPAAEDLFVLAALTRQRPIRVLLAPRDPRPNTPLSPPSNAPAWTRDLYDTLEQELRRFDVQPFD